MTRKWTEKAPRVLRYPRHLLARLTRTILSTPSPRENDGIDPVEYNNRIC